MCIRDRTRVTGRTPYAEIVASLSSKGAGPGTRANIDEFTETTAKAIEEVGGADRGKAIIILNPVEPPMKMRNTVFVAIPAEYAEAGAKQDELTASIKTMAVSYTHLDVYKRQIRCWPADASSRATRSA